MLRSIGLPELVVIFAVATLLFGGRKIPELMKGVGEGLKEFKGALKMGSEAKKEAEKL